MSTPNTWPAMSASMLSPAELAVWLDEDLVALMAASCPHARAEHPSPDVQYPVGDRTRDGAPVTTTEITQSLAVSAYRFPRMTLLASVGLAAPSSAKTND